MALFSFLNKKQTPKIEPVLPQDIYEAGLLDLRDIIAPAALLITPKNINLGEKIARTLFVISYPRFLNGEWFSPVVNFPKVFDISIFIHPIDTSIVMRQLQKRVAEVQSQISMNQEKGAVRDPILETAYRDIERLRDELQQGRSKMFNVGLYVTIYADNEEELDKIETEIKSVLDARLVYLKPALFQQGEGFISILPICQDELEINYKLNSSPLSTIFPFVSFDLTSNKGILYGINMHNSSLVMFDRFSLENYNSVIFAKSGSGKSYITKLEIIRSLMFDTDVIVIDPEREYEYLAEAVGGRYFNISLTSEHHINPFDLPPPAEDESMAEVLRDNIINLVGLFRVMLGGLTPEEDSIIDNAITETYALKDITPDSDFTNKPAPLLSDLELVLAGMEGGESLAQRLLKYTQGSWSGFINKPSNVDINRNFIVFSIRDMQEELKTVAMYIITHHIWTTIRKSLKKRLLVVDEAWIMMRSEDTANFLFSLVKRGRKYYLGVSCITQDVNDFLKSTYGMPIITNSSMQLLLKQSPASIDLIQKTFHLTDEEKFLLLESAVGEGIFLAGLKRVFIEIVASYTEHQIITSDPSQILAIRKAREELKSEQK
ncbi:MAG TPA: DUF87 domain-containing protein [Candidatus Vogelbacteria bacterium]|nr:DUF87 domain-containing protein [Candidatus Vogelbacteria bacterium]